MAQNSKKPSLGACIALDVIGVASYIIPGIGEGFDLIWAPISGIIFYNYFHSVVGSVGAIAEEILPFTDFIPAFTLGHFLSDRK